ncbi:MAG: D-2-hydroxyacid dehydrogenase [Candidatus Rokubacteria bacterium]|nr:D-2-hydroxyacid dehydrogenase [Candidatus Rokubacteria bacterium]MBI3104120.1 D-2-hydroxyacid dehydrogenase [Candidatus Rokubacteria bacterium]
MTAPTILVYHPEEARDYARLIRLPRRGAKVVACATAAEADAVIAEAEILYGWGVPAALLARAARLRWIQCMGAGVERFLVPEVPAGVTITRAAGIFGPWMAEYVLGWSLWGTQRMETFRQRQRERRWVGEHPARLHGATICIIGLGDIGRAIARSARSFGMTVVGVSRSGRRVREASAVYRTSAMRRALARADFVVVTLPLTDETRGLIGAAELSAMKPSAWLINIARGQVVEEAPLVKALSEHRIGGAVLDVFEREPLPPEHPLWSLHNAVITPHISGPSTPDEIAVIFNDNLRRYLSGRPLRHVVSRRRGY